MRLPDSLVSIGLPVRNGERTLERVIRSVLAQDHEHLELVISDNASTDRTEALCRDLAETDSRIVYHRQPRNIGLLNNFVQSIQLAKGAFFRWMSDSGTLAPHYLSRCLEVLGNDDRLILVTTDMTYARSDGATYTHTYRGTALGSSDPIARLNEFARLLVHGMFIDPLYGLVRREPVAAIPRHNMLCEDQIFATKLLLTAPWSHVPEVLAHRLVTQVPLPALARRLGVPTWQAYFDTAMQCRGMLRAVRDADLRPPQRRRARAAVARVYIGRHYRKWIHRARRLTRLFVS